MSREVNNQTVPGAGDFEHKLINESEGAACVYCGDFNLDFRRHFLDNYAMLGAEYGRYSLAYELGHSYAHEHRGSDWARVEPRLRELWQARGTGEWEQFQAAIRFGWEQTRK